MRPSRTLDGAIKGAERAASLTAQLRAFARRQPLKPEAIDVARLLARISTLLDRVLGERIRVETVRSGGLWPAYCDAAQLEAALLNLPICFALLFQDCAHLSNPECHRWGNTG